MMKWFRQLFGKKPSATKPKVAGELPPIRPPTTPTKDSERSGTTPADVTKRRNEIEDAKALTAKLRKVLCEAPESELIPTLEDLVARGADINDQSDILHFSALHYAAAFGKSAAGDWLLAKGANIEARSSKGLTPLCEAAHNGHAIVVEKLITKGADISVRDEWNGLAALTDAAFYGHPEVIRVLLANGNDVNDQNRLGTTALHYAAGHGQKETVKFLLSHGANVEQKTVKGKTPLDDAREAGHLDVAEILLAAQGSFSNANRPGNQGASRSNTRSLEQVICIGGNSNTSQGSSPTFVDQLKSSASKGVPGGWAYYDGVLDGFGAQFRYPKEWHRAEQGNLTIFRPDLARMVDEAGKPMISPGLTFFTAKSDTLENDALLDAWLAQMGQNSQGFVQHESEKFTIDGVRTLAVHYDFQRASGTWSAYVTLRVKGRQSWYFDASGLKADLERLRPQLVTVLGLLHIG